MKSPFKFLDAYTKEDKDIFFGRDTEIEELYQKVFDSKVLLVCGVSGTGKTSLINCGLANKFEESDWLPIHIRRGRDIIESFKAGISKMAITEIKETQDIEKQLQSLYLDHFKPIYLIFDQFEEVFIFGNREERKEFIKEIKKIIDSDIQCRLLFVMREEYLAGAIEFERDIPTFLTNRIRIEKMTWHNAKQVIEEPCKVSNIEVEEGLTEAILGKLSPESTEVELTYLQVFLDKIFKLAVQKYPESKTKNQEPGTRNGEHGVVFSHELLDEAGDVSDLLGSFLEEQISLLGDPETGLVVLKAFVSVKGTKRQITEDEVVEFSKTLGKPISKEDLTELIQRYVNLRFLRDKDENDRYELRHDSLAAKIFEKITLVEKELLEVRQFIENAYQTYEKRQLLLTEKDLRYLKTYEDRLFLEGKVKEYVELSKKTIQKKLKQFKTTLRISLVVFFLLLAGIGYYYYQISSEAKNIKLASIAIMQSEQAPELSFKSALRAYYDDTASSMAHFALIHSFNQFLDKGEFYDSTTKSYYDPARKYFDFNPCEANIHSAVFSRDGKLIYGWLDDNTVKVWSKSGKELLNIRSTDADIITVALSDNNRYIAGVFGDSTGSVWNIEGSKIFEFPVVVNPVYNKSVTDFSPDSKYLAVAGLDYGIHLYDLSGNRIQDLMQHTGNINYLTFSPDGRFIASASSDKRVYIWNYNFEKKKYGLYDSITHHWHPARSCNFSENSKYILTAADDSTIVISDLNGDEVHRRWIGGHRWNPWGEHACNAEFIKNEELILLTRYSSVIVDSGNNLAADSIIYTQALINESGAHSYFEYLRSLLNEMTWAAVNPLPFNQLWEDSREPASIVYNTKRNVISLVAQDKNQIRLVSHDLFPLRQFNGHLPSFDPNGDYLLCIQGNELNLYPVSTNEIIRLVLEEKIFGWITFDPLTWFTFF